MDRIYCEGIKHRIRKGDTLYKISKCYNVPLASILRANAGVDVYNLIPGSTICIPDNGTWQNILTRSCVYNGIYEEQNENNDNLTDDMQEQAFNDMRILEKYAYDNNMEKKVEKYTIMEGDTLEDIIDRWKVSVSDLLRMNYETGIPLKPGFQMIVKGD